MRPFAALFASAALLALSPAAHAYAEPDPSYTMTPIARSSCGGLLTLLGDQGVLVSTNEAELARLRADGSLDTSWGIGGIVRVPVPTNFYFFGSVAVHRLSDGGFLVAGTKAAARLRANGTLDETYGVAGLSDPYRSDPYVLSLGTALLPDGSLVSLSDANAAVEPARLFTRIGPDGRLDASLGAGGRIPVAQSAGTPYAFGVQADGRVQLATLERRSDGWLRAELHRYPDDFTAQERADLGLMPRDVAATWTLPGARVDPQGRLLVATRLYYESVGERLVLSRFDAQGQLDLTFGTGGSVVTTSAVTRARHINFEPDGAITLVAEYEHQIIFGGRIYEVKLFRYTDAGMPAPGFPNGLALEDPHGAPGVVMDDAGRLLYTVNVAGGCGVKRLRGDHGRSDARLVEYRQGERYFIAAEGPESAFLDAHATGDAWQRTGRSLGAWLPGNDVPGSLPMCRFYGDLQAGPRAHFYSLEGVECDVVRAGDTATPAGTRAWRFEGFAFSESPAGAGGACPANLQPVRRLYNDGFRRGVDPGHRFAADPAVVAEMQSRGWILEGVAFCAPPAP